VQKMSKIEDEFEVLVSREEFMALEVHLKEKTEQLSTLQDEYQKMRLEKEQLASRVSANEANTKKMANESNLMKTEGAKSADELKRALEVMKISEAGMSIELTACKE
jgi:regulator of replication initiation timing